MHKNGTTISIIAKESTPPSEKTKFGDSEDELIRELEQKRKQIDDEIARFRAQKEMEFRNFERELRASKRRKSNVSPPPRVESFQHAGLAKPPSRTSSSSALNLLAGHVVPQQSRSGNPSSKKMSEISSQKRSNSRAGPSVSQPVVSLDKLNIKGENALPSIARPQTPPTPTLLSRKLTRSSSGSSLTKISSQTKTDVMQTRTSKAPSNTADDEKKQSESLAGIFTPSYIRLLEAQPSSRYQSSSALESPPTEDETATAPSSFKSSHMHEVLPLSSSSFPPHVTISPGGHSHSSKRSYTAPTVSKTRIPSALRTASGGTLGRKAKHVTFRLADSAIVEPSSSYEEGPSPEFENGKPERNGSGMRSPLRTVGKSALNSSMSPDDEDAEAGVEPGMGMGDVIQRLNDYTIAEAAKNGEDLVLEVNDSEEEVNATDDDDDDNDDDDLPMEFSSHHEKDRSDRDLDVDHHEHDNYPELIVEDGYFSPKNKHNSTLLVQPRGNSPLVPKRDVNWAELSSSDKDRLLFGSRRHSDDSDTLGQRTRQKMHATTLDETGFTGGLGHSMDGGSGVGFFELDEELASPDAGQAKPFDFGPEFDETDQTDGPNKDYNNSSALALSTSELGIEMTVDEKRRITESASKFGVGSVPIDIVRPSLSVSSSWIGTFGH